MIGLSQEGEGFFALLIFILLSIISIIVIIMLLRPIEYSANCEISGVNIGINKDMNFTGFNLNDSKIKCDISGEVPLTFIMGLK